MRNLLFVISGPSGVGKGTLVEELLKADGGLQKSVSCTTRLPRPGETPGRNYYFVDREAFERGIEENAFLEYDAHFENYYGTPRAFVEKTLKTRSVILEIDVKGGLSCKRQMPERTVLIFIAPPDLRALKERLLGRRAETEEQIELRLARAEYELSRREQYDYVVVNDDLQQAKEELLAIIQREKNRN